MASLINGAPPTFPVIAPDDPNKVTMADAYTSTKNTIGDWVAAQRALSAEQGLWNDQTGLPTQKGLINALHTAATSVALGTGSPGESQLFHRNTAGPVDTGVGYMMYSKNAEDVAHYGSNHYVADLGKVPPEEIVDASSPSFQKAVEKSLADAPHLLEQYQATAHALASEVAPANIVDSAGLWDAPDLAQHVYDTVLAPAGHTAVKTPDGIISFDPSHAELQ